MNDSLFDELKSELYKIQRDNSTLRQELASSEEKFAAATRDIFKDIVTVLDAFERTKKVISEKVLDSTEEAQKVRDRFLNVEKTLKNKLANLGVQEIDLKPGDMSDSNLCAISDTEPDDTKPNDMILSVDKKGYLYKGDVIIRPAEVVIVKN